LFYHPQRKRLMLFGGIPENPNFSGVPLWELEGGVWQERALPLAPRSLAGARVEFEAVGGFALVSGGQESRSATPQTWLLRSTGTGCTNDADCPGAFCTDGVCCESNACATCETCNGSTPGRCAPVLGQPDPDSCTGNQACSLSGRCLPDVGTPCDTSTACASGHCVDGVCCETACDGTCQACSVEKKLAPANPGRCGRARTSAEEVCTGCAFDEQCGGYRCINDLCATTCTSIRECAGTFECVGGRCVAAPELASGSAGCGCANATDAGSGGGAVALIVAVWIARRRTHEKQATSRRSLPRS
jgi:hypothetical protein